MASNYFCGLANKKRRFAIKLVAEKRPHPSKLQDALASVHHRDFVLGHQLATIRSREISASIILQSQSQLKTIYKDAADTIVGNCDTTLFLGGKEKSTLKEISELLGKETIDSFNQSENRGSQVSHGFNYQKLGKDQLVEAGYLPDVGELVQ